MMTPFWSPLHLQICTILWADLCHKDRYCRYISGFCCFRSAIYKRSSLQLEKRNSLVPSSLCWARFKPRVDAIKFESQSTFFYAEIVRVTNSMLPGSIVVQPQISELIWILPKQIKLWDEEWSDDCQNLDVFSLTFFNQTSALLCMLQSFSFQAMVLHGTQMDIK